MQSVILFIHSMISMYPKNTCYYFLYKYIIPECLTRIKIRNAFNCDPTYFFITKRKIILSMIPRVNSLFSVKVRNKYYAILKNKKDTTSILNIKSMHLMYFIRILKNEMSIVKKNLSHIYFVSNTIAIIFFFFHEICFLLTMQRIVFHKKTKKKLRKYFIILFNLFFNFLQN